jgi:diguanylate cyclase (GGDEF)-like protein
MVRLNGQRDPVRRDSEDVAPGELRGTAGPSRLGVGDALRAFLRAFTRGYTYDLLRNGYTLAGFLWGLPIPLFALLIDFGKLQAPSVGDAGRYLGDALTITLLLHPLLFAAAFGAFGTVRHDLSEENRRLVERLRELALTDPLTGLHNRRFVLEMLVHLVFDSERTGKGCAVALFDLDGFKRVNDTRGHLAGDALLRDVGLVLRQVLRRSDLLGRYGGDEFLLVTGGSERARAAVERARSSVLERLDVRLSAGIASWPEDGRDPQELIRTADLRLAEEKAAKRTPDPFLESIPHLA